MNFYHVFFALSGGILPALLWLWFWLKEDRRRPEPRRMIIYTFLAGMASVALALPFETLTFKLMQEFGVLSLWGGATLLLVWAFIEEVVKYVAAHKVALSQKDYDEPVDAIIYLITAALGFAAAENVIFLVGAFTNYDFFTGFVVGNLRFVGATLLHILSSAAIGVSLAFCFFHKENVRRNLFWGLVLATLLHMFFNYFIINSGGKNIFYVFLPFWSLIIVLLLVFEKVKKLTFKK